MDTENLILYTDGNGSLKGLPKFPPNTQVEIFFRVSDPTFKNRRLPNSEIVGKIQIKGDIFDTVDETQWNLPQ